MFSFFKRPEKESWSASQRSQPQAKKTNKSFAIDGREPIPLPQVTEGNEDSDWALWEDSVMEQDSQMHGQFHDTVPSEFPHAQHAEADPTADPFAAVGKHAA